MKQKTIKDLNEINSELIKELCISALGDFSVTADFKDNTKNILDFYMIAPILPKDIYMSDNAEQIKAYKDYLTENLVLSGETKESAQNIQRHILILKNSLPRVCLIHRIMLMLTKYTICIHWKNCRKQYRIWIFQNIKGFGIEV